MKDWTMMYTLMAKGDITEVERIREEWISSIMKNLAFYSEMIEKFHDGQTIILLCADHGDDYGLHGGVLHADSLPWDSVVKTPLVMYPAEKPGRIEGLSSNIDIKNMVLSIAKGDEIEHGNREHILITGGIPKQTKNAIQSCGIVTDDGYKYIHTMKKDYLWFLHGDRDEKHNLYEELPHRVGNWMDRTKRTLIKLKNDYSFLYDEKEQDEHLKRAGATEDKLIEEQLKALGYL